MIPRLLTVTRVQLPRHSLLPEGPERGASFEFCRVKSDSDYEDFHCGRKNRRTEAADRWSQPSSPFLQPCVRSRRGNRSPAGSEDLNFLRLVNRGANAEPQQTVMSSSSVYPRPSTSATWNNKNVFRNGSKARWFIEQCFCFSYVDFSEGCVLRKDLHGSCHIGEVRLQRRSLGRAPASESQVAKLGSETFEKGFFLLYSIVAESVKNDIALSPVPRPREALAPCSMRLSLISLNSAFNNKPNLLTKLALNLSPSGR